METLEFTRDGDVGWLRLNRPDKLNSFTVQMWHEMRALGSELARRPRAARARRDRQRPRVLVGHRHVGVHRRRSADALEGGDDAGHATPTRRSTASCARRSRTRGSRKRGIPTIAAVRGYALGAGLQLALACDIRVFARGTKVGLLEHKYGILPDLGGTQRLPRVVGAGKAKEMIWTAARIDADEAYRIGLCERLVDDAELETEVDDARARRSPRSRRSRCRARSARSTASGRLPVARRARRRSRGAGGVPALRRHARGDHRVRRTTRSRLLAASSLSAMTRFRVRASGPLDGVVQRRRARPRTRA